MPHSPGLGSVEMAVFATTGATPPPAMSALLLPTDGVSAALPPPILEKSWNDRTHPNVVNDVIDMGTYAQGGGH